MEALQEEIDQQTQRLEQHVAELRQKLTDTTSIKDFWRRRISSCVGKRSGVPCE